VVVVEVVVVVVAVVVAVLISVVVIAAYSLYNKMQFWILYEEDFKI